MWLNLNAKFAAHGMAEVSPQIFVQIVGARGIDKTLSYGK